MANWYSYTGTGSVLSPSSYTISVFKPLCLEGANICAIYLQQTSYTPTSIDADVINYINVTLATRSPQPPLSSGFKTFVYAKPCC